MHKLRFPSQLCLPYASYCAPTTISTDAAVKQRVDASVDFVVRMSAPGAKGSMYGVNTGVGASGA